ncbi:MAG: HRDC domain-containing protein [Alphaproteobacteria bacterium]|nr:MAG: HRDC domain-containing protein [Alphaproteobacteria bacterium]
MKNNLIKYSTEVNMIESIDELHAFFYRYFLTHTMPSEVFFDTEFHKRNTYWPLLCILQLKLQNHILVIDTLTCPITDSYIATIFADHDIVKVCHACEQDLQTLEHANIKVNNCFDTQIGAAFCKFGYPISYQNLVESITQTLIEKSHQNSCWDKRPLNPDMITYAAQDVAFLDTIFYQLRYNLKKTKRFHWVAEEIDFIKRKKKSTLYIWRDMIAARKNLPPTWIIDNKTLHKLGNMTNQITEIRSVLPNQAKRYAKEIYSILNAYPKQKEQIDTKLQSSITLMMKIIAHNENIPPSWICDSENIRFICANKLFPKLLGNWRKKLIWETIHLFLNGRCAIALRDNEFQIVKL